MNEKAFYMVYLDGGNNPKYIHQTLEQAEIEAKRLAKEYKKKAFVLTTIKSFEINEFIETDCRPYWDGELPF